MGGWFCWVPPPGSSAKSVLPIGRLNKCCLCSGISRKETCLWRASWGNSASPGAARSHHPGKREVEVRKQAVIGQLVKAVRSVD